MCWTLVTVVMDFKSAVLGSKYHVFQGDSGGPMSVKNSLTQQHTLVGVNSWGRDQCDEVSRDS